ncbi:MAG: hybrid sensor histidine kinase/response regulator [Thermoleophilia bacterium]
MHDTTQDGPQRACSQGGREDSELLAKILETSPVGITVVDASGQITFANRKAEKILGLVKSEITSRVYNDPEWRITTFSGSHLPDEEFPFQKVRTTGKAVEDVRHAIVWPDGRRVCLSINASPLTGANGGFAGIVAAIEDITAAVESERALERQSRANQVLTQCNEVLIRAADETSLLSEVCHIVVEGGGYRLAWVAYAEEDGSKIVKPVTQCGFEEGYLDAITVTWDETETGSGPTGTAMRTGQPVCTRNIISDPAYAPWRDEALKRGYASSLALPLITNSHVLGVLNIYAAEPDAFDAEEERLLMQMADDLAYGISALRVREERTRVLAELKASREDWKRIFNSISDPVMILDLNQNILAANPATEKMLGLTLDRILGRKCHEVFHLLDESAEACTFKSLIESGGAVKTEEMEMEALRGTFLLTVAPIFDDEGKLSRVLHIAKDITGRKQAEEKLQESEMMYKAIFEATGTATMIIDEDTTIIMANKECLGVTGYSHDELIGTKWTNYITPESLERILEYHKARREDSAKAPGQYEEKLVNKEGQVRDILMRVTIVPRTKRSVVSMLDITDRKKMEEVLRESEARFRSLFDNSPLMLFVLEPDGTVVTVNPAGVSQLGYPAGELIGQSVLKVFHPEDRKTVLAQVEQLLKSGSVTGTWTIKKVCKDGTEIWVNEVARQIEWSDGRPVILILCENITERMQAEIALKESETKLRAIFEQSRDAIGVSRAGVHVMVNSAYVKLFGYEDESELPGTSILKLIAPGERDKITANIQSREAGEGAPHLYETRGLRKDGSEFDMEVSASTYELDNGTYTLVILRDISEHKVLEESLRQAQRMESVGRLAGGVAHDFNNFLTAVEGYIDLALLDLPKGGDERKNLLEARHSAERAANLTRQLLLFSRREPLELRLINLNTIVTDLLKMLERLIGEQFSILSSLDDDLPAVKADSGQIEQVLMNLMVNARDAMAGGGEIEIGTKRVQVNKEYAQSHAGAHAGEFASFYVRDTGSGMDTDVLSHIFEPFFTTKKTGRGTGLGLSVAYGIITEHGGWIDVESKPGSGSIFSIFLPSVSREAAEEVADVHAQTMPTGDLRGQGEKILLVEDDESVRVLAKRMLSSHNYDVVSAASAEEALDIFEKNSGEFRLVFSDVILPGMDGIRLIERLIELKPGLRVMLASGFVEGVDFQTICDKGYRLLEKPYVLTALLRQVREVLEEE